MYACVVSRAEEADDIVLSSSEIKRLALRIEEELYKVYGNTGHKYRAKFRSLLFNIKDQKNKVRPFLHTYSAPSGKGVMKKHHTKKEMLKCIGRFLFCQMCFCCLVHLKTKQKTHFKF